MILRALNLLFNATSIIRYMFVFWLKNPAAFKDDFFYVFINSWIFGACFLFQLAITPFQYQRYPLYNVFMGQQPLDMNSRSHNLVRFPLIITLLLHSFVCVRLAMFKRKTATVNPGNTCTSRMIFLREIDSEVIVTFADNFVYFVLFALALRFNDFLEQIHEAKDWTTVNLSIIVSPPTIQLASFALIYIKNKKLRAFFWRAVLEFIARAGDLFGQNFYDVN